MSAWGIEPDDVAISAFNLFLWSWLLASPMVAISLMVLSFPLNMFSAVIVILPFLLSAIVLSEPSRRYKEEQRSFLVDTPAFIGAMGMSMGRTASLERAVEFGSRSGNGPLQRAVASVAWRALTGELADLRKGLSAWTSGLDKMNDALRRSLHLLMAAEESDGEAKERLLDRANAIALDGMREACERYVGSLSFPVMLVFAFGVLAPVMLFSLIPLLGMDSGQMAGELDLGGMAVVLLVLVPTLTLAYIRRMMARNPLKTIEASSLNWSRGSLIAFIPLGLLGFFISGNVLVGVLTGSAVLLASLMALPPDGTDERAVASSFVDALYRLGNAMLGGQDLEGAFEEVVLTEQGPFKEWGSRILHIIRTDRTSLLEVVRSDRFLADREQILHQNYLAVMACAMEDHLGAGKLAVNLANSQGDLMKAQAKVRENLRPVVDMMSTTSTLFAPAIIGLTTGIMGLLGDDATGMTALACVYVIELAFLVNYFLNGLDVSATSKRGWRSYGKRGAIALGVFLTASLCGQSLLFHLL